MKGVTEFLFKRFGDAVLGMLCLAAVATFAGKLFWVLDLATHFQVYYFWAAAVLLVANLVMRRKIPILISLGLVAVGVFHLVPYYLPAKTSDAEGGKVYTAMLININYANQKTAAVKQAIDAADPDLLVLQEVTPRWRRELDGLTRVYKSSHDFPEEAAFGIWALSKFEFADLDVQRRKGTTFLHLRYKAGGKPIEVVALHPIPPVGGRASKDRNALLADATVYASGEGTRLAIGDFNCSPWSPYFKSFVRKTGLRDSALGRGVNGTWFPLGPFGIPIDHILVSPDIEVVDRTVGGDLGSDHRPVVLKFRIGEGDRK